MRNYKAKYIGEFDYIKKLGFFCSAIDTGDRVHRNITEWKKIPNQLILETSTLTENKMGTVYRTNNLQKRKPEVTPRLGGDAQANY